MRRNDSQFCVARVRWWVGSRLDSEFSLACTCEEADVSDPCSDEWSGLPLMLTVEDAARVLRIGRSHAYNLTKFYFVSGGNDGLPALRLGDLLRVPKAALYELVTTGRVVQLIPNRVDDATPDAIASRKTSRPGRRADRSQLSLLGSD